MPPHRNPPRASRSCHATRGHPNPRRPHQACRTDHQSNCANQRTPHQGTAPVPRETTPHQRQERNAKEKANINITSLNMNGATAPSENMSMTEKWAMVNRTIFNERIAVLALQETHLDDDRLEQVRACFGRNLEIINSPLPGNPRASAGVAFVINKALIRPKEYSVSELDPGRAIMIRLKWLESCTTSIVNVYAPNDRGDEQPDFWKRVMSKRRTLRLPLPDFVLGDFNITEDSIDRVPAHADNHRAIEALREVRREWNIQDTWRHTNPTQ